MVSNFFLNFFLTIEFNVLSSEALFPKDYTLYHLLWPYDEDLILYLIYTVLNDRDDLYHLGKET